MRRVLNFTLTAFLLLLAPDWAAVSSAIAADSEPKIEILQIQGSEVDLRWLETTASEIVNVCCDQPAGTVHPADRSSCRSPATQAAGSCFADFNAQCLKNAAGAYGEYLERAGPELRGLIVTECKPGAPRQEWYQLAQCAARVSNDLAKRKPGLRPDPGIAAQAANRWSTLELLASFSRAQCLGLLEARAYAAPVDEARRMGCLTDFPKPSGVAYNPQAPALESVSGDAAIGTPAESRARRERSREQALYTFKSGISGGSAPIECPDFIPRWDCNTGTRFDWARYDRDGQFSTGSNFRSTLGGEQLVEQLNSVYDITRGDFELSLVRHLSLQASGKMLLRARQILGDQSGAMQDRIIQELSRAGACHREPGLEEQLRGVALPLAKATGGAGLQEQYERGLVHAAHCTDGIQKRLKELAYEMGRDVEYAAPLLKQSEIESLPPVVREVFDGITALPIARQFTREFEWPTGMQEAESRNCGYIRQQVDPSITLSGTQPPVSLPRSTYCRNIYSEYALLISELNDLQVSFPALHEQDVTQDPTAKNPRFGWEKIIQATPGGLNPDAASYNLDFNRARPGSLSAADGKQLQSCVGRFQKEDGSLLPPSEKALATARAQAAGSLEKELASMVATLRQACSDPETFAREMVGVPALMQSYFDCENPLSRPFCADRRDSTWMACRLYRDHAESDRVKGVLGQLLQVGMDGLFIAAPGISGFAPSLGRVATSAATGGIVGGGLGALLADSNARLTSEEEFLRAGYYLGYQPEQGTEKLARARRIAEMETVTGNSRFRAGMKGAVQGAFFGALGSRGTGTSTLGALDEGSSVPSAGKTAAGESSARAPRSRRTPSKTPPTTSAAPPRDVTRAEVVAYVDAREMAARQRLASRTPSETADAFLAENGWTRETRVYRWVDPEYINLDAKTIEGNPNSVAQVEDIYSSNFRRNFLAEHVLDMPADSPALGEALEFLEKKRDEALFRPPRAESSRIGAGLNCSVQRADSYGGAGKVLISMRMGDFLEAGGLVYPDVGALASGVQPLYLTVPQGKSIPFRVEQMP